jgi:hypothetical protein
MVTDGVGFVNSSLSFEFSEVEASDISGLKEPAILLSSTWYQQFIGDIGL